MRFEEAPLPGVWVIDVDPLSDERGWFARTFDATEFATRGLNPTVAQCNASFNVRRNTLRGLHYQAEPHAETKLVRPELRMLTGEHERGPAAASGKRLCNRGHLDRFRPGPDDQPDIGETQYSP